jgi:alpha-L-rhamnosidase
VDATPLDAGFHTVVLHPVFDARLGSVAFDYDSPYGTIHSDWKITGSTAVWHLILPANTTGRLKLTAEEATHYRLKAKPTDLSIPSGASDFIIDL